MDMLSIFIIIVATLTAIAFKVFLYKRIQRWMDQDLIKGLADGNSQKHDYLVGEHLRLIKEKTSRKTIHEILIQQAKHYSSK